MEACDACDDNAMITLVGDFPVEEKNHENLYLCKKHYFEFIDSAPVEILRVLIEIPLEKLLGD